MNLNYDHLQLMKYLILHQDTNSVMPLEIEILDEIDRCLEDIKMDRIT